MMAVVGGRLGYGLIHFDYYSAHPAALPAEQALFMA